ncbi:MAG: capsule assembly Wzi family protein [Paludibacteraceae bacterium]
MVAKRLLYFVLILSIGSISTTFSQTGITDTEYKIELMGASSTGGMSAFWLQNNRNGTVSFQPHSGSFTAGIAKTTISKNRIFDYGFKADAQLQIDGNTRLYFPELYANARLFMFEVKVGRSIEYHGNQDSTLSSGGLLFSQNALPLPSISAGIPQFTTLPFTFKRIEIKGAIIHGIFTDNVMGEKILLHHKYGYVRVGGDFPVKVQYGLHHVAQWGGNIPGLGQQPAGIKDFKRIFLANSGDSNAPLPDQINTLGNHIISQNLKLELDFPRFHVDGYWQNLSEDGPVRFMTQAMNISDGLWGIVLKPNRLPIIKGVLYEFVNTTDQSGPYHDKDGIVYGGNDSYFNNGIYQAGWTYFSRTIGIPFITSPVYSNYFDIKNNRVKAHHLGINGKIESINYKMLLSFTKNYGTYSLPFESMKRNTLFLVEFNRRFPSLSDVEVSVSLAADRGSLYGNNSGCMIRLRKTGNLFNLK